MGGSLPTDRFVEIRERLNATKMELVHNLLFGKADQEAAIAFITAAPDDMEWLLAEVQRLRGES